MGRVRLGASFGFIAFLLFVLNGFEAEAQIVSNFGDTGARAGQTCATGACGVGNGPLATGKLSRLYSIGTGFDGGCGGSTIGSNLKSIGLGNGIGSALGGGAVRSRLGGVGQGGVRARVGDRLGRGYASGGTYVSVIGGFTFLDDQQSTGFNRQVDSVFNDGSAVGGAIGTRRGRTRYEIEYMLRNNSAESIDFNGNSFDGSNVGGNTISHSGMFNMAFDLCQGKTITPYVGAGVGFAFIDSDLQYGPLPARLNGQDNAFAYQFFAGLSRKTNRGGDLFVEYRYFSAVNPKLNRFGGPGINGAPQDIILDSHYDSHNVLFGLRFQF